MLDNHQRHLANKTTVSVLCGTIVWIVLLTVSAKLFASSASNSYDVAFGPFVLNTFTRQPQGEAVAITLSFESGLIWYFLAWLAIGITLGVLYGLLHRPSTHE